ncbi:MAG TPA: hypothetical protein VJ654_14680 [Noviherbaspirillum sp.]|nr:hypothetical protein [Noviherbaspirillum sp.]
MNPLTRFIITLPASGFFISLAVFTDFLFAPAYGRLFGDPAKKFAHVAFKIAGV